MNKKDYYENTYMPKMHRYGKIIGFTGVSTLFDLPTMPLSYMLWLAILMVVYMVFAQIMKVIYIKRHKDWY